MKDRYIKLHRKEKKETLSFRKKKKIKFIDNKGKYKPTTVEDIKSLSFDDKIEILTKKPIILTKKSILSKESINQLSDIIGKKKLSKKDIKRVLDEISKQPRIFSMKKKPSEEVVRRILNVLIRKSYDLEEKKIEEEFIAMPQEAGFSELLHKHGYGWLRECHVRFLRTGFIGIGEESDIEPIIDSDFKLLHNCNFGATIQAIKEARFPGYRPGAEKLLKLACEEYGFPELDRYVLQSRNCTESWKRVKQQFKIELSKYP